MAVTVEELIEKHGFTADEIAHMEAVSKSLSEKGELPPAKKVRLIGRPTLTDEKLVTVTFKVPESDIEQLAKKLDQTGQTRSQYLRTLIERDLAAA